MAFHFFTSEGSISVLQNSDMAFGSLPDQGSIERYNLENKFSVTANAPAFAITKSLVVAVEDANNSSLLNFALLPLDGNYAAGFPVKFFLYRGILKSSLISGDNIRQPDSSWDSSNILEIIHDIQDQINQDTGSNDTAKDTSLGIDFGTTSNDTVLEAIFFDELDDFHPLIVPRGCQIGKFAGGSNLAGMEVVLDKVGEEPTLGLLKASNHIFQIPKLITTGLSNEEKLKQEFTNRHKKETVLAYMDITAFYGACENQGIRVKGVSNGTDYLNFFRNKKCVYIDIRDERGFSYNHFSRLDDNIDLGFYTSGSNDPVYTATDYYQGWPILKLENRTYATAKDYFYIKLPIFIGMPEVANILTAFNKRVSVGKSRRSIRYKLLNELGRDGEISLQKSDPIRLKSWDDDNNFLGANYFLLKLDKIESTDRQEVLSPAWNSFFSLDMNPIFSLNGIEDGEFRVKTYASINAPLIAVNSGDEVYYPTIGIAADKSHVTFFSFYRESAHRLFRRRDFQSLKIVDTGKFNYAFDAGTLNYQNAQQSVGFLYQLPNGSNSEGYSLEQFSFTDPDNNITDAKFLAYLKNSPSGLSDAFFENFDAITFTHEEYNHLKSLNAGTIANTDFISDHPFFVKGSNNQIGEYQKLNYVTTTITLGVPKVEEDVQLGNYVMALKNYPAPVEVNNEEIILSSIFN